MSRWHRENPEYYEQYGEPDWLGMADQRRKEARENPPNRCAHCLEPIPSHKRWCSDSCFYAEDGPPE